MSMRQTYSNLLSSDETNDEQFIAHVVNQMGHRGPYNVCRIPGNISIFF